jgi:GDP-L-fucose synthase
MLRQDVLQRFKGKKVLVTGGDGLVGRQVVEILLGAGADVTTASLGPGLPGVPHICGDLRDMDLCVAAISGRDAVFHLAGLKGSVKATRDRPADYLVPMLMLNCSVLEACRGIGIPDVLYTSSIGAYPELPGWPPLSEVQAWKGVPMDSWPGWAKRIGELQVEACEEQDGYQWTVVRLSAVYGPGDRLHEDAMLVPSLMRKVLRGDDPVRVWGDGSAERDLLYSRDAAEGLILAMAHKIQLVNIGSGRAYTVREVVETLAQVTPFNYTFDPGAPSGFTRRVLDISLAREKLGFEPHTSLEQGLRATWESLKESHGVC